MKIPITLKLTNLQADLSEYLQRSLEFEPVDVSMVVEMDAKASWFHNEEIQKYWKEKTIAETTGGDVVKKPDTPSPVLLTLEGVKELRRIITETFKTELSHPYSKNVEDDENEDFDETDESYEDW